MRRPSNIELAVQLLIVAFLIITAVDLVDAWTVDCNKTPLREWCHVWGGEGPVAGLWRYQTQYAYTASGAAVCVLLGMAALLPFIEWLRPALRYSGMVFAIATVTLILL